MRSTTRTVNPALSQALTGRPTVAVDERAHALALHDVLLSRGAAAVIAAGAAFARNSRDELVVALAHCSSPHELTQRFRRIERLFHLGHRTEHVSAPGALHVQHLPHFGEPPSVAESLFVCGAFIGMCERIGVPHLTASLTDGRGRRFEIRPMVGDGALHGLCAVIMQHEFLTGAVFWTEVAYVRWSLWWTEPVAAKASATPIDEHLRLLVAEQPCHPWRLAAAADTLGLSRRSLQRALAARGTTAQSLFVAGRVDAAAALLQRTSLPVAHVAALTGFTDAAHLTRCCRRVLGATPAGTRRTSQTVQLVN